MQNLMVVGAAGSTITTGQNLTRYVCLTQDEGVTLSEVNVQVRIRDSLTWSRLRAYVISNTFAAGNNTTITARVNGVDNTTLQLTIDGGVTGEVEDLTGSISVVSGDLINWKITTPNVAGAIGFAFIECLLDGSVGLLMTSSASRITAAASTTYYAAPDGAQINTSWTTEAWAQMAFRESVTVDRLRGVVATIGTGGSVNMRIRKNGVNGAGIITWTGITGEQEDTINTDSFANTDLLAIQYENTNTAGTTSIAQHQVRHNGTQTFIGVVNRDAATVSSNLTRDILPEGDIDVTTTEAQSQVDANATRVVKNMRVYVSANTLNGSTTFTLRRDGVDTALAVTYASTVTGVQEDLVDSVTYTAAQEMSTRVVTGGTMNSMVPRIIQYTQENEAAAATSLLPGRAMFPGILYR